MRTTIDLPEEKPEEARRLLGTKTKCERLERALDEAIRAAKADEIRAKLGTYRIDLTREDILKLRKTD